MPIERVLIANRGEIALRIIRACHELDIGTVAVFSDADRSAPHVMAADHAVRIGPPPSSESYLNAELLVRTALDTGCDAVHPGYGFLAERAFFAQAVEDAGLTFIGPPAAAIAAMGDKTRARSRMKAAGVPIVPGVAEPLADPGAATRAADEVGYPVILKAAAGGGGKGMRVVHEPGEMQRSFEAASREAVSSFGDGTVYLERFLQQPRHIEIQILADRHDAIIHLGERECSIQRRHQKMIEEAPSPAVGPELRAAMGQAAIDAARAVGYVNAGTVEFLVEEGAFYFLEMNTRIQVEHPVTELVTGIDLVQWQLRIAGGMHLDVRQEDVEWTGHAIECRVTSEDPGHGFLPSTGRIERLDVPAGPGVRWDGGVQTGSLVTSHYDPMVGKLIVHAPSRAAAIERMRRALRELRVVGIETSMPFHARVMTERDFQAGDIDIRYIDRHPDLAAGEPADNVIDAAAVAAALLEHARRRTRSDQRVGGSHSTRSAWREALGTDGVVGRW